MVADKAPQAEQDAYTMALHLYTILKAQYNVDLAAHPDLLKAWQKSNNMVIGNITLCLSPAIQQNLDSSKNAEGLWNWVKETYGSASIPSVYRDLKEAISIHINPNQHPGPQFDKMSAAIQRLSAVSYTVNKRKKSLAIDLIVAELIALPAIPMKWENSIPIICSSYELEDITISTVCEQVVTQYENKVNCGGHKQPGKQANPANAHKLSAVKWKHSNPRFSQQECQQQLQASPSNPNQQQSNRQRSGRGSGCSRKLKGKGKQHSHVASAAAFAVPVFTQDVALPPPSSSTITSFGPSGSTMLRTVYQSPSTSQVDGVYPSVNQVLSLLERMDVNPTIQRTETLEQRFHALDKQIHTRAGFYEDEDYFLDEDMSQTVPGCEIFGYTPTNLAEISCESIAHDFEYLAIDSDGIVFDPNSLDKENHAPTLPYISPQSVDMELGHSDPEAEAEAACLLAEEIDIAAEWATKNTYPLLNHQSSNNRIEEAWQCNQDFINRAPTPGLPADFDDSLQEALDWGSSDEEKYTFSSFSTINANSSIVLDPLSSEGSKGSCNTSTDLAEVCKMYNVNFGVFDVLKCEHKISFTNCAEC